MSQADVNFIKTCCNILENGFSNKGEKIRPHWADGTPAYTRAIVNVVNEYNIAEEFPAVTLRKTYIKSTMDELLWIWQKKSNNVHDLNSHVWDEWADPDGFIGNAYGASIRKPYYYKGITEEGLATAFPFGKITTCDSDTIRYSINGNVIATKDTEMGWRMDQVNKALYDLKNNPFSRRIIVTIWIPQDLHKMALEPCAYSMTFMVSKDKDGSLVLNGLLNQRSNDMLAAGAWNVAQYALLIMMFAQVCGMKPGKLTHVIANAHIYDRHIPIIVDLIGRRPQPAPEVRLDEDIKDFYEFTTDNLHISNYKVGGEQITDIPIAI